MIRDAAVFPIAFRAVPRGKFRRKRRHSWKHAR
jgi:hypothetical protein